MSLPVRGLGDPLANLLRAEKALLAAGARGEAVADELKEIRDAIRGMVEQREVVPHRERERER